MLSVKIMLYDCVNIMVRPKLLIPYFQLVLTCRHWKRIEQVENQKLFIIDIPVNSSSVFNLYPQVELFNHQRNHKSWRTLRKRRKKRVVYYIAGSKILEDILYSFDQRPCGEVVKFQRGRRISNLKKNRCRKKAMFTLVQYFFQFLIDIIHVRFIYFDTP